ncbi:MAG: ABC transporter permease subunit [Pseudothermotoga sp.]
MNVYRWEMKRNFRTLIVWTVILILIQLMYVAIYPSMAKDTELLSRMMKVMPKTFLRIFGLEDFDFSNILNYLATISTIYVTLVGSIFAALLASKMLAKEENEKTAEFLLSKPIKRTNVVRQKLLTVSSILVIFDTSVCLFSLLLLELYKRSAFDYARFWLFWLSQIILHLTIANLIFAITVFMKRQDSTISLAIGTVFVLYILAMVSKLTEKVKVLGYFTPFYYSDGVRIIKYGRLEPVFLVTYLLINTALIFASFLFYSKKDVYL